MNVHCDGRDVENEINLKPNFHFNWSNCFLSLSFRFPGKNRLYPAYSVSSSETDDSPVHNNNKTSTNISSNAAKSLQYNFQDDNMKVGRSYGWTEENSVKAGRKSPPLSSTSHHQYTLTYKQSLAQQQQQQNQTSKDNNATDANLSEATAVTRKNTLINNGKIFSNSLELSIQDIMSVEVGILQSSMQEK